VATNNDVSPRAKFHIEMTFMKIWAKNNIDAPKYVQNLKFLATNNDVSPLFYFLPKLM